MLDNLSTYLKNEDYRVSLMENKVHILNYTNIIDITENEAIIKAKNYIVRIKGKELKLIKLDKKELLISGFF